MQDHSITTPRNKRERIAVHYSRALHGLLNYFGIPESVAEFIQALLLCHGYDSGQEFSVTGAELAAAVAPASTTDQLQTIRDRLAKQRKRLSAWQGSRDSSGWSRPVLVGIRAELEQSGGSTRYQYWYSLPVAELVRQVIDQAPVGANSRRMKAAVAAVAKEYLDSSGLRPVSRVAKRRHTPESQIRRGLAYLASGMAGIRDENDVAKMVKNAISENAKLLPALELLKQSVGIFPTGQSAEIDGLYDDQTGENSAYTNINIYAQFQEKRGGAAGAVSVDPFPASSPDDADCFANFDQVDSGAGFSGDDPDHPSPARCSPILQTQVDPFPASSPDDADCFANFDQVDPARDALRVFESVGVAAFDESTLCGDRRDYVPALPADLLHHSIRERMAVQNFGSPYILRPLQPERVKIIQLDDFDWGRVAELVDLAFIVYQTSPQKFQAWLAVECDELSRVELTRALKRYFGADQSASGATRWPGSLNTKYTPAFPVTIRHTVPGRVLRVADLPVRVDQVASPSAILRRRQTGQTAGQLPDYQRELENAGGIANTADFTFALKALSSTRGCTEQQVIEALLEHSPKAKKRGRRDAERTVSNAARVVTK